MGLKFGNLCRIIGLSYYTVSPYEQKALSGVLEPGIRNTLRRTRESFFLVTIPILVTYLVITTANEYHRKMNRKNPADFVNDV